MIFRHIRAHALIELFELLIFQLLSLDAYVQVADSIQAVQSV